MEKHLWWGVYENGDVTHYYPANEDHDEHYEEDPFDYKPIPACSCNPSVQWLPKKEVWLVTHNAFDGREQPNDFIEEYKNPLTEDEGIELIKKDAPCLKETIIHEGNGFKFSVYNAE